MIKNLNDVLSLFTLILLSIYGLGVFLNIFNINNKQIEIDENKFIDLFKNYTNNTEE